MLIAAAVCPNPPLLVPELASAAAGELDGLRAECRAAVEQLWRQEPDEVFVVGVAGGVSARSFAPWGVDIGVDVPEPLPLPLLVGGWLTGGRRRSFVVVGADLDRDDRARLGAELAAAAPRVALLAMGDGSACHSEKAPGYLDPRAAGYDDRVANAFTAGDPAALLALDEQEAAELQVAGLPAWQVLAGAAAAAADFPRTVTATFSAPYGVGYHVVTWA